MYKAQFGGAVGPSAGSHTRESCGGVAAVLPMRLRLEIGIEIGD